MYFKLNSPVTLSDKPVFERVISENLKSVMETKLSLIAVAV